MVSPCFLNPKKLTYRYGEALDDSGMVLLAEYNDGTAEEITSGWMLIGYDPNRQGKQTILVQYLDRSLAFDVTVEQKILEGPSTVVIEGETGLGYFETLSDAIASAKPGDVVKLTSPTQIQSIVLSKGITLDLNGQNLKVDSLVALKGNFFINSVPDSGFVEVAQNHLILPADNPEVPVWNGANGYDLKKLDLKKKHKVDLTYNQGKGIKMMFKPVFGSREYETQMFADGCENNDLKICVKLAWKSKNGSDVAQRFVYSDEMVKQVYGQPNMGFSLSIASIEGLTDLQVYLVVESDCGVQESVLLTV